MNRGYGAKLVWSDSGALIGFATGSDACAEHECGSKPLRAKLCSQFDFEHSVVAALGQISRGSTQGERRVGLSGFQYPSLLESKRVTKFPKGLRFVEKDGTVPEALLSCADFDVGIDDSELAFATFPGFRTYDHDPNVAGAWCENAFALHVRSARYVNSMRGFYEAILKGQVVFGSSFFRRHQNLTGVILVNSTLLSENDTIAVREAQSEYESSLRLKARDDTAALRQDMRAASGIQESPGFIWVRWKDETESDVVYCLNPAYGVKAGYLGPYTRSQLLAWAGQRYSFHLKPERSEARTAPSSFEQT